MPSFVFSHVLNIYQNDGSTVHAKQWFLCTITCFCRYLYSPYIAPGGPVEDSFLSSLYPSMLSVFSSPPSCWFLSPPSSSPPPSPPCPPSFHCCSGPALSLVPRIQATHTHKQFWVTLWEYTSTQLGSKLSANTHTHTTTHTQAYPQTQLSTSTVLTHPLRSLT